MARLEDLSLSYWFFMKAYRSRSVDWSPGASLSKPLSQARLALITTAGLHLAEQPPFGNSLRGGDFSFRELSVSVDIQRLAIPTAARRSNARASGRTTMWFFRSTAFANSRSRENWAP